MKVFLDDNREAPPGWIRTYSVAETIALLKTGRVTELSLDHDLGIENEVGNGYDVLLWIEKQIVYNNFTPPAIMKAHTANSSAYDKMERAIKNINERLAVRKK